MTAPRGLNPIDKSLLSLFLNISNHRWEKVADLGRECLEAQATLQNIIASVRHIVVWVSLVP